MTPRVKVSPRVWHFALSNVRVCLKVMIYPIQHLISVIFVFNKHNNYLILIIKLQLVACKSDVVKISPNCSHGLRWQQTKQWWRLTWWLQTFFLMSFLALSSRIFISLFCFKIFTFSSSFSSINSVVFSDIFISWLWMATFSLMVLFVFSDICIWVILLNSLATNFTCWIISCFNLKWNQKVLKYIITNFEAWTTNKVLNNVCIISIIIIITVNLQSFSGVACTQQLLSHFPGFVLMSHEYFAYIVIVKISSLLYICPSYI